MGAMRKAESVSFDCSRTNDGCNINELAKSRPSQRRPGPKRRASTDVGSKVKLKRTKTSRTKTSVVESNSRERSSTRTSFASITPVERAKLIAYLFLPTPMRFPPPRLIFFPTAFEDCAHVAVFARIFGDGAGLESDRARDGGVRLVVSVRAHQDRAAFGVQARYFLRKPRLASGIEPGCGLVEK